MRERLTALFLAGSAVIASLTPAAAEIDGSTARTPFAASFLIPGNPTPEPTQAAPTASPRPSPTPSPTPSPEPTPAPDRRTVRSTAYCLTGTMANGERAHDGAVAMNGVPFGWRWRLLSGTQAGRVLTVKDRISHGSDFDIAMPGRCSDARRYGRQTISIERVY